MFFSIYFVLFFLFVFNVCYFYFEVNGVIIVSLKIIFEIVTAFYKQTNVFSKAAVVTKPRLPFWHLNASVTTWIIE